MGDPAVTSDSGDLHLAAIHDWYATCYHEAGHAVAAYLTGRRLIQVDTELRLEEGRCGLTLPKPLRRRCKTEVSERQRQNFVVFCFGGPIAEANYFGEVGLSFREWERRCIGREERTKERDGDYSAACYSAPYMTRTRFVSQAEITAYLEWCWVRTRCLLELGHEAVDALAEELLWTEGLEPIRGDKVARIITNALGGRAKVREQMLSFRSTMIS